MAISAATVWEIRLGGSDTNGGGFVTGASGSDWTLQDAAQYSVTDGVTAGTTTITSATAAFGADVVGNLISVSGGTGSVAQNWYQIISRTNATTIVVDRSTGLTAGTGTTLKIGGALATPGGLGAAIALNAVSLTRAYWKYNASTFDMTVATNNVSGGILTIPNSITFLLTGYDTVRGDRTGNRPKMSWASVAAPGGITYMVTCGTGGFQRIINITLDGNSVNNVGGFSAGAQRNSARQCVFQNFNGTAGIGMLFNAAGPLTYSCAALTCTTGFSGAGVAFGCYASGCATGFLNVTSTIKCIAYSNTNGFSVTTAVGSCAQCVADSNTTAGFVITAGAMIYLGCISSNQSGGGGVGFAVGSGLATMNNCFSYNNTSEITGTPIINENMTLNAAFTGGQPYVAAGLDFRANATSGAGALLRTVLTGTYGQTDNMDATAVQHADPATTGGMIVNPKRTGGKQ